MKIHTIEIEKIGGDKRNVTGTTETLAGYFRNILVSANTIDRTVNFAPKTIRGLMSSLRKAKEVDPNNYSTKGRFFTLVA